MCRGDSRRAASATRRPPPHSGTPACPSRKRSTCSRRPGSYSRRRARPSGSTSSLSGRPRPPYGMSFWFTDGAFWHTAIDSGGAVATCVCDAGRPRPAGTLQAGSKLGRGT
jgi:hypothetical protein